jgi:mono/diheme cytochrome c family protein
MRSSYFVVMMRIKYVVAVASLIAAVGAGAYILSRGFSARDEPTAVEAFIARRLRLLAIPRHARELTNPVPVSDEVFSRAMMHFADHCASCHGNDGRGETPIGRGLYPKPPDMTQTATQQLTDGDLYYIIENGVRFTGMPAFGEDPGNEQNVESWDLVHFIRRLPRMTDDELAAMKKMNPRSPMELEREERIRKFLQGEDNPPAGSGHEHH